jgi:CheY-like chemotaxis protein
MHRRLPHCDNIVMVRRRQQALAHWRAPLGGQAELRGGAMASHTGATHQEGSDRKVLLVEDEVLVAMFATDALTELGYDVVEAGTARAALDEVGSGRNHFAFAVVDFGLPDRPGEELVAELKALRPELPIIIASGYTEDVLRSRVKTGDRLAFLTKPYDLASLQSAIDALVGT